MRLLVHGSGFDRPFKTDAEELRCGKPAEVGGNPKCQWSPSTKDWEALGTTSGGSTPAKTVADLVKVISSQGIETIEELRIIGHSNNEFFALGGLIVPDNVKFDEEAMIGHSKTFLSAVPALRALQNRFTADARIVLAGCGSGGVGSQLLDLMSNTILRTTAGFKQPILYGIDGDPKGPMLRDRSGRTLGRRIDNNAVMLWRGRAMYSTAANDMENVFSSDLISRSVLKTDAWTLAPDAESRVGNIFGAVGRAKANPWTITVAEVGYKILNAYHPARSSLVHGIGYAGELKGIQVVADKERKTKMSLDIGKGFINLISPRTLEQRARELIRAVDELVVRRKEGTIAAA
jgi:hypothetical protein